MKTLRRTGTAKKEQALRSSELRYRRLFEAAQEGILILDATTGVVEDANPYLLQMLGYSRDECLNKKLSDLAAFADTGIGSEILKRLQHEDPLRYADLPLKARDGRALLVDFLAASYRVNDRLMI